MEARSTTEQPLGASGAELSPGTVAVLGVPFDANSSFLRGAALAPARIRETLHSGASNLCAENGLDLGKSERWQHVGDLALGDPAAAFSQIEESVANLLDAGAKVLSLGGDHSITYPIMRAYGRRYTPLTILQVDAHPDLYDELDGNRLSHACPFARIMEETLVTRLVQIGIRTLNPHQRQQAERFGVEVIEMGEWKPDRRLQLEGPLYLSLDLDALDPAYAPGVSHHEPGGFSSRQLLEIIKGIETPIVGADIVEYNPERDPTGITAALAAKLLKEILAQMLR